MTTEEPSDEVLEMTENLDEILAQEEIVVEGQP
jgi:hypothetical protein